MLPDFSIYHAIGSPVFVLTEDASGKIVYAFLNAAGCRHLLCSPSDVVGKTALETFNGRSANAVYHRQCEAWAMGVETSYEVAIPLGADTLWVLTRLVPQHDAAGRMTHMVGLSQDITQEKRLFQAQEMTTAMVDEMEDFVSFAAHDLRSPLANVRMLADLLRDGFVDMGDGKLELIQMIEEISTRALDLVTDVLSHTTAARSQAAPTVFDFRLMCENILVTLDPTGHHTVSVPDRTVEADTAALQIIMRNLFDNAIKYAGLAHIAIDVTVEGDDDGWLSVTVADNGRGFSRTSDATDQGDAPRVAKGGFGLAGITRLVRSRGGTIEMGTGPDGVGAAVHFSLPGRIATAAASEEVA